jgi:hypothetical protein
MAMKIVPEIVAQPATTQTLVTAAGTVELPRGFEVHVVSFSASAIVAAYMRGLADAATAPSDYIDSVLDADLNRIQVWDDTDG